MAVIRLMTQMNDMKTFLEVDGKRIEPDDPLHGMYLIEYNTALIDQFNKYISLLVSDIKNIRENEEFAKNYLVEMDKKNVEFGGQT